MTPEPPFFKAGDSCSMDGAGDRIFCALGESLQGGLGVREIAMLLLLCQSEETVGFSWMSDLGYFSSTGGERDFLPGEEHISWEPDLEFFLTGDA